MMLRAAKGFAISARWACALAPGTPRTDRQGEEPARDGAQAKPTFPTDPKPNALEEN
jgi:hypothetical protein